MHRRFHCRRHGSSSLASTASARARRRRFVAVGAWPCSHRDTCDWNVSTRSATRRCVIDRARRAARSRRPSHRSAASGSILLRAAAVRVRAAASRAPRVRVLLMPESVSRSSTPRRPGRLAAVAAVDARVDRPHPIASWRNVARRFRSRSAPRPVFAGAGARRLDPSSSSTRSARRRQRESDLGPTSSAAAARAALRSACGSACSRRGAGDAGPASAAGRSRTEAEAPAARALPPLPPS